jgi:hypothetical protein
LARRQASEQNFTSFQVRAQRRRQVIGRPQAAQGLLGRAALLPRNPAVGEVIENALGQRQRSAWDERDLCYPECVQEHVTATPQTQPSRYKLKFDSTYPGLPVSVTGNRAQPL